jgi:hypothetical protein
MVQGVPWYSSTLVPGAIGTYTCIVNTAVPWDHNSTRVLVSTNHLIHVYELQYQWYHDTMVAVSPAGTIDNTSW